MKRREFLTTTFLVAGASLFPRSLSAEPNAPVRLAHLGVHEGRFNAGGVTLVSGYNVEGHYMAGQAVAQLVSRHVPGAKAILTVVATPADALRLLRSDGTTTSYGRFTVDLALIEGDELYAALRETDGRGPAVVRDFRLLAMLPPHLLHIVALHDSPIAGVNDLKGKTVSIGPAGSRSAAVMRRLLDVYDLSGETAYRREALPLAASMKALAERRIEAFAWHGPVSPSVFEHLGGLLEIRMTLIPHGSRIARVRAKYGPVYYPVTIRKGAYSWLQKDVQVVGTANLLLARAEFPSPLAYEIAKTLGAHGAAIEGGGKRLTDWSAVPYGLEPPVPLHPGAERFRAETK